jgi:hypothetical protein
MLNRSHVLRNGLDPFGRTYLNRIAADYDVNPGRISEIKLEGKYSDRFLPRRESLSQQKGGSFYFNLTITLWKTVARCSTLLQLASFPY